MFNAYANKATLGQALRAISSAADLAGINPSALHCVAEAKRLVHTRGPGFGHEWALESLAHSVGVFSSVYQRVKAESR